MTSQTLVATHLFSQFTFHDMTVFVSYFSKLLCRRKLVFVLEPSGSLLTWLTDVGWFKEGMSCFSIPPN